MVAIGATFFVRERPEQTSIEYLQPITENEPTISSVVPISEEDTRAQRLADLRKKIAASGVQTITMPEVAEDTVVEIQDDDVVLAEILCGNTYEPFGGQWDPARVSFDNRDSRLVLVDNFAEVASIGTTTASSSIEILYTFPPQNIFASQQRCISSEVIGVAQDGSLIRNDEAVIYKLFDAGTLIGYALDGVPIYGKSDEPLDRCGGLVKNGAYRYQLSEDRGTMINCYSQTPINI